MPAVLAVPLRASTSTTPTLFELFIAFSNILSWLIVALCIVQQHLENHRLEGQALRYLKRCNELIRAAHAVNLLERIAEDSENEIEDEDEVDIDVEMEQDGDSEDEDEDEDGFQVVPERKPVQENVEGLDVEEELREAMEEELLAQQDRGEGSDNGTDESDELEMMPVRIPAKPEAHGENDRGWEW